MTVAYFYHTILLTRRFWTHQNPAALTAMSLGRESFSSGNSNELCLLEHNSQNNPPEVKVPKIWWHDQEGFLFSCHQSDLRRCVHQTQSLQSCSVFSLGRKVLCVYLSVYHWWTHEAVLHSVRQLVYQGQSYLFWLTVAHQGLRRKEEEKEEGMV